jgi:3-oxoacyl-[acyl-carrier protein] reductase
MQVNSKSIIITGTRKGIGKFLAERYLEIGHKVYGCSRGSSTIDHPFYSHYQLDVSDEMAVVKMVREVGATSGVDILINNAGVASMNHLLLSSYTTGKKIFDCNYWGTFYFIRESAKIMRKQKKGRIVNFTTVAVPLSLEGEALYASSKGAVEVLTRVAAKELADFGVTVNAVGPTPVKTDLIGQVPNDKIEALISRQAIKRMGKPEDIAGVVDFFISDFSEFITGQTLYLGGING